MNTLPKRLPRTPEQLRSYFTMLERIAAGESIPESQILTIAATCGGWEPGKPNDYVRDISLVRLERAAREAAARLPELLSKAKEQRTAIRQKGEELGLAPPYLHGDSERNIVTRHPQLRPLVAEHAKTQRLIKELERDERAWRQDAPELAARRAGKAVRS